MPHAARLVLALFLALAGTALANRLELPPGTWNEEEKTHSLTVTVDNATSHAMEWRYEPRMQGADEVIARGTYTVTTVRSGDHHVTFRVNTLEARKPGAASGHRLARASVNGLPLTAGASVRLHWRSEGTDGTVRLTAFGRNAQPVSTSFLRPESGPPARRSESTTPPAHDSPERKF